MKELEIFKNIFEGLNCAYGITKKSSHFDERGKNKTESFTIPKPPIQSLWKDHLEGKDPALGIVPIRQDNKCKWGCIDIDIYPFNHKKLIQKLKDKKLPVIVFRSKSGGAHCFLFTKDPVPAVVIRVKLKIIASIIGHAKAEIYPKQDYIRIDRGDKGSFLNLPYHGNEKTVRYAFNENGEGLKLSEFFLLYEKTALTKEELNLLDVKEEEENDDFKGIPPCLKTLLSEGVQEGQRNNCMYNVGVYLKKRFSEEKIWKEKMDKYNEKYMKPQIGSNELVNIKESVAKKEYRYKCNDEPIVSFCNSKKCMTMEFGVGDDAPVPEMTDLRKYDSDPPIYFVSIGGDSVEVDDVTLHDPEKFSLACMNQIGKPMMPVPKQAWRKILIKLFSSLETIPAPSSSKIDIQLKEILAEYINKTPGKDMQDVLRGISFTDSEGNTFFKFPSFWRYLLRTKSWAEKTYPKQKTIRLMEALFNCTEVFPKIGKDKKSVRLMSMKTIKLDKPNLRINKIDKEPWQ